MGHDNRELLSGEDSWGMAIVNCYLVTDSWGMAIVNCYLVETVGAWQS